MTEFNLNLTNTTAKTNNRSLIDHDDFATACFPVSCVPLTYSIGGTTYESGNAVVVATDNMEKLATVTDSYALVKNEDILLALDKMYDNGFESVKVRNVNRKQFQFDLINRNLGITINGFDAHLRLSIVNSYDTTRSLRLQFGAFIQVCSNGLHRTIKDFDMTFKHIKGTMPNDITKWMLDTFVLAAPLIKDSLEAYAFPTDDTYKSQFARIASIFPKPTKKDGDTVHPIVRTFERQAAIEFDKYKNGSFAVFMAATDMATRPDKYGIPASYVWNFESIIDNVFFGEKDATLEKA